MTSRFLHSICVQAFYTYIFFRAQAAYCARSPAAYRLPRSHIAITSFRYKAADDIRAWLIISGTYAVYPYLSPRISYADNGRGSSAVG